MKNLIELPQFIILDIPGLGRFNAELSGDTYYLEKTLDKKVSGSKIEVYNLNGDHIDTINKSFELKSGDVLEVKYSVYVNIQ